MNSLLSGLSSGKGNSGGNCSCGNGGGNCNTGGGCGGGNSIIWIIILLCLCGGCGQGKECGTVCGCDPKHCKELCKCGSSNSGGFGGFGGFGGGCGGGSGIWIIIILLLCFCGGSGKQGKGCTNNFINLDNCEEEC